jgi:hypothetical protein
MEYLERGTDGTFLSIDRRSKVGFRNKPPSGPWRCGFPFRRLCVSYRPYVYVYPLATGWDFQNEQENRIRVFYGGRVNAYKLGAVREQIHPATLSSIPSKRPHKRISFNTSQMRPIYGPPSKRLVPSLDLKIDTSYIFPLPNAIERTSELKSLAVHCISGVMCNYTFRNLNVDGETQHLRWASSTFDNK